MVSAAMLATAALTCIGQVAGPMPMEIPPGLLSDTQDAGRAGIGLLGKLESGPRDLANRSITSTDPTTGLALTQRYTWDAEQRVLFIDSTLTNTVKQPRTYDRACLAALRFSLGRGQDSDRYASLEHRADEWYGSTYWTGPDWTRVGKDWHHPGTNTPSVRRWTAPADGRIRISGRVAKADLKGGDGVRVMIRHGEKTVWKSEIDAKDGKGVEPKVELAVRRGDAIRFVVHKRGRITCDTTRWDPVITYVACGDCGSEQAGKSYRASKGFSKVRQGEHGWSYEMEVDAKTQPDLPTVHTLADDGALSARAVAADQRVEVSPGESLGFWILADVDDQSGLVIAAERADRCGIVVERDDKGAMILRTSWRAKDGDTPQLAPGATMRLPRLAMLAYEGAWLSGVRAFSELVKARRTDPVCEGFARAYTRALATLSGATKDHARKKAGLAEAPELDLWVMVQQDWRQQDKITEPCKAFTDAAKDHLGRTKTLINELRNEFGRRCEPAASELERELPALTQRLREADASAREARRAYLGVRWLKRRVTLANPLMQFGPMLFCKRVPTSYSHLVMQYYGWRARPGGSLFVLDRPGRSLAARDILDGRLADGNILEPRLSYDAKRIVFSWVRCKQGGYDYKDLANDVDDGFYHIYEVNVDGSGLRQLTRGPYDDTMPTYLPDGGIAFCSTRRRGYARCFGAQFSKRWHVYTLHRMDGDGGNLRTLSFHDTNEWFPAVSHDGLILYSRWDYIDRDAVTHQNLWATRPDGTHPFAVWGNATPSPHCTFQIQPIPGSNKIVFTASAHHSITAGSIAVLDPALGVDGLQAITRITPSVPFPEAEGRDIKEYYASPWPLSERYFLCAYSPTSLVWERGANDRAALGIYLIDAAGNRELIYRHPDIGSTNPTPLVPRKTPPVIADMVASSDEPTGEMVLLDVYRGLGDVARGTIKQLRIIQIFPKSTHQANTPLIGMAREENARAVLGTVPVEADGSARFLVPARTPILFQALDEHGMAYQTMRSLTYVQPGERVSCIGCHERQPAAPEATLAMRRPPSKIKPGPFDGEPFSYVRVVQPVLDKHCVRCHSGDKAKKSGIDLTGTAHKGFTRSYYALCSGVDFRGAGTNPKNAAKALVPMYGMRNQIQVAPPGGMYGARGSRLMKMLRKGHHEVKLSDAELRRLAKWIDCNAVFYGAYQPQRQAAQLRGEVLAMPELQ